MIEGASDGKGLGIQFLKHIERSKVILHLVDFWSENPADDYLKIRAELKNYSELLAKKMEVIALTKTEGINEGEVKLKIKEFKKEAKLGPRTKVMAISSAAGIGTEDLLSELKLKLDKKTKLRANKEEASETTTIKTPLREKMGIRKPWDIKKDSNYYIVSGEEIEKFAIRTDFSNPYSVERLYDILRKMRIYGRLQRMGYSPDGDYRLKIGKKLLPREDRIWD